MWLNDCGQRLATFIFNKAAFIVISAKEEKMVEFKELTTSSRRATFVKDHGWATMPGENGPDNRVATECADQIMLMDE